MLNYQVSPDLLQPLVPRGTELDFWEGKAFVSVVGFLFLNTRVCGMPAPFHRNFEEVNLRFYVRRKVGGEWRRAVVFVRELVPRRAIAWAARVFYNENYSAVPMAHRLDGSPSAMKSVLYSWRFRGKENHLKLATRGSAQPLQEGSEQEFITEHYFGYARQRDGSTLEYQVEHPRWRFWEAEAAQLNCDVAGLYGESFLEPLTAPPASAFLAEGSPVKVFRGIRLKP